MKILRNLVVVLITKNKNDEKFIYCIPILISCNLVDSKKMNLEKENLAVLNDYVNEVSSTQEPEELIKKFYLNSEKILSNEKYILLIKGFNEKIKLAKENDSFKVRNYFQINKDENSFSFEKKDLDNIFFFSLRNELNEEEISPILIKDGKIQSFTPVKKGEKVQWW